MNPLLPVLSLSFLGSVAGLVGGLFLLWKTQVAKKASVYLISFAAGVILSVALLDLLPQAVAEGGESVFSLALVGLIAFFFLESFLLHFHHHEKHRHQLSSAVPLIIIGDSLHNFVDGVVIAASFLTSPQLGFFVAVATFAHEIPQEIGDFGVLLEAGLARSKVLLANLLSALATFLGAVGTILFVGASPGFIGPLLGLASGMFLYIASADILPELVRREEKDSLWRVAGFFLAGVLLIWLLLQVFPE